MKQTIQLIPLFLLATLAVSHPVAAATKPVHVFILAGQSNMEGAGQIKSDPKSTVGIGGGLCAGRTSVDLLNDGESTPDAASTQRHTRGCRMHGGNAAPLCP